MTTHILSMTYQPKIESVRNGTIRQTIRLYNEKRPFKVGEKLLIHGWEGRMYRSPWSWRMEAKIDYIMEIECTSKHLISRSVGRIHWKWSETDDVPTILARYDGISPPTGQALKETLERYHGKFTDKPVRFQVIRW